MYKFNKDIEILEKELQKIPKYWDGKQSILELKEADYNWRQMEWWAFYFEYQVKKVSNEYFQFPGDRFGSVEFDLKGKINWDLKATALKTNNQMIILNDKIAMEHSIAENKFHGEIIGVCDVEYNDINRSFQKWHTELKGGKSNYEIEREKRTSLSRYRKTKAEITEIILVVFKLKDLPKLSLMKQGRNSNGSNRNVKYMLNIENIDDFTHKIMSL